VIAAGPLWIVASVVVAAGLWKLADPAPTARALQALAGRRLARPVTALDRLIARSLGAAEIAVAVTVVWRGGRSAFAMALLYLAFALAALRLRGRNVDCGCFGAASARASWIHVAVNTAAVAVATWAGAVDVPGVPDARPDLPAAGVGHLVLVAAGTAGVVALLTVVPALRELRVAPATAPQTVLFRLRSERP
jgi:hypothetical protein